MLMHKQTGAATLAGCVLLMTAAAQAQDDLQPAGLAVYTDTAREIYLAAILTPSAALPADMNSVAGPVAMEYRIATRRISSRGLSGTMLLQAELGSGNRAPDTVIDALGGFKQAVQGSLLKGDHVQVRLTGDNETVFRLNGTELTRSSDPQVFQYLLTGWVGDTSSALLRDALLMGDLDASVRGQYVSLVPSDERTSLVASWSQEAEIEEEIAVVEEEVEEVAEVAEEKVEAVIAAAPVEEVVAEPVVAAAPAPVAKPEPVVESDNLDYIEVELDDREYQLQLAQYVAKVMTKVFSSVVYPRRAVSRSLQGKVALVVELDETGKLIDVSTDSSSGHGILDRAAVKAVKAAAPFPELSLAAREEFASEYGNYQVAVPVTFRLN